MAAAAPPGEDPFGQPEHTGGGKHQIEDILPHAERDPGKDKSRYITPQKSAYGSAAFCGAEAEKRSSSSHPGSGSILGLGEHIQIYDEKKDAEQGQCRLDKSILRIMPPPDLHTPLVDRVQTGNLYTVLKQAVPGNEAAQFI